MRRLGSIGLAVAVLALTLAVGAAAGGGAGETRVAIFYYPWYGTAARDGDWQHWSQNDAGPPARIASAFYPARGAYSSTDSRVLRAQMGEIAGTGIDTIVVSWWGPGSVEARRLPAVAAAARAAGLDVAAHIEPWLERTAETTRLAIDELHRQGVDDFYVYDSTETPDSDWAEALDGLQPGVRVFANTWLAGKAAAGGFQGLYPYDVVVYPISSFRRVCRAAHRLSLACAPSVGPGFDARRATGLSAVVPRKDGQRYDAMWKAATRADAEVVTITSYNEWLEGTQIEPARPRPGYQSYERAYGLTGTAATQAYLTRTRMWVERLR